jgi:hypothetical protein
LYWKRCECDDDDDDDDDESSDREELAAVLVGRRNAFDAFGNESAINVAVVTDTMRRFMVLLLYSYNMRYWSSIDVWYSYDYDGIVAASAAALMRVMG